MFCGIVNIMHNILRIQYECRGYSTQYYQSHEALWWILIMLCIYHVLYSSYKMLQVITIRIASQDVLSLVN